MTITFSIRIPLEDHQKLKQESHQQGLSINKLIIKKLSTVEKLEKLLAESKEKTFKTNTDPIILEILFLLRELVIEKNSQILRRAQIQLDTILGEDRPKIGT